jgi:hypothetical protein
VRAWFANLFLGIVLTLYAVGLGGMLFLSQAAMLFSVAAFLLTFLIGVIKFGFRRQPFILKRLWAVTLPCFVILFVTTILLSLDRGAPKTGELAVFAPREQYVFTRGAEVSRVRFVTVATCFAVLWHGFGMVFAIELQAHLKGLPVSPTPRRRRTRESTIES